MITKQKDLKIQCPVCKDGIKYGQFELEDHIGETHDLQSIKVEYIHLLFEFTKRKIHLDKWLHGSDGLLTEFNWIKSLGFD